MLKNTFFFPDMAAEALPIFYCRPCCVLLCDSYFWIRVCFWLVFL